MIDQRRTYTYTFILGYQTHIRDREPYNKTNARKQHPHLYLTTHIYETTTNITKQKPRARKHHTHTHLLLHRVGEEVGELLQEVGMVREEGRHLV